MKKILFDIAKVITAIVTIGGSALWFDSRFDEQAERSEELLEMVDYNSIHLSQIDGAIQGIQDTLDEFEEEHKAQGQKINSLVWGIKNIERFTPEDFEDVLNEMINNQPSTLAPYSGDIRFIPID